MIDVMLSSVQGYYIIAWLVVLVISLIIEAFTTELVSVYSALGAILALILAVFNLNLWVQLIGYVLLTIITLLITRPIFMKYLKKNEIKTNTESLVGKQFVLKKGADFQTLGEIVVNGVVWSVKSHDNKEISIDEIVEVVSIEGSKLIVKKI